MCCAIAVALQRDEEVGQQREKKKNNIWRADFRDRIRPLLKRRRRDVDIVVGDGETFYYTSHATLFFIFVQGKTERNKKKTKKERKKEKCVCQKLNSLLFVSTRARITSRPLLETPFSGYKDTQRQWHHTHTRFVQYNNFGIDLQLTCFLFNCFDSTLSDSAIFGFLMQTNNKI